MKDVQVRLSTLIAVTAIASAGAFAAGRSTSSTVPVSTAQINSEPPPPVAAPPQAFGDNQELPPNHPPIGNGPADDNHGMGAGHDDHGALAATTITWKVPPRWKEMPNTSSMRLATYRVPRAEGDKADGDVSVMQAGGSVDSNVERWIGQFGPGAKAKSKTVKKKIGNFDVTIVEAEGTYGGGMGGDKPQDDAGLLGAIVETPDMPHFFKITGPKKTVASARAELDALLGSITPR